MQQEINNNFSKEDEFYMKRAIELAKRGTGWVNPNPLVGAVIVKDDRIIGEGWHRKYGELHAERDALSRCMEDTSGATIYVTLEPCCHHGKQPPCTEALVQAGISRVVIGSMDPNPLVSGKGVKYLEEHGIKVEGTAHLQDIKSSGRRKCVFFAMGGGKQWVTASLAFGTGSTFE